MEVQGDFLGPPRSTDKTIDTIKSQLKSLTLSLSKISPEFQIDRNRFFTRSLIYLLCTFSARISINRDSKG